jgi:hypothetical protein
MKCQAWVDPAKFNKKGLPTPRASIGAYTLDWDRYLSEVKGTLREKREQQKRRAVRCGGKLEVSMYADCGDEGTDGVEVEVRCNQCQEYIHSVGLNSEVAEQWLQDRLDAMN